MPRPNNDNLDKSGMVKNINRHATQLFLYKILQTWFLFLTASRQVVEARDVWSASLLPHCYPFLFCIPNVLLARHGLVDGASVADEG